MQNIAIILAGGSGKRLGANTPKQFLKANDKMIIEYTIEAFQNHNAINEIAIVCHVDHISFMKEVISKKAYNKVTKVIEGGKERYHSSLNAIRAYADESVKNILFHDAARPLVSSKIISDCVDKLQNYNAVGTGIETTDTIWSVKDSHITNIPDRRTIFRAQTPQGFEYKTIKRAYDLSIHNNNISSTDDCGVLMHTLPDERIAIVKGEENNFKITRKEDLTLFENIINSIEK